MTMDEQHIFTLTKVGLSVICWLIVAAGAVTAVFSSRIQDTLLERVGLGAICIAACAAAWRAYASGWVTNTGFWVSVALAFYVIAVFKKHSRREPLWGKKS